MQLFWIWYNFSQLDKRLWWINYMLQRYKTIFFHILWYGHFACKYSVNIHVPFIWTKITIAWGFIHYKIHSSPYLFDIKNDDNGIGPTGRFLNWRFRVIWWSATYIYHRCQYNDPLIGIGFHLDMGNSYICIAVSPFWNDSTYINRFNINMTFIMQYYIQIF